MLERCQTHVPRVHLHRPPAWAVLLEVQWGSLDDHEPFAYFFHASRDAVQQYACHIVLVACVEVAAHDCEQGTTAGWTPLWHHAGDDSFHVDVVTLINGVRDL